jgi:hypothetical protein
LFLDRAGHVVDVALERRQPVCQPIAIVGKAVYGLCELPGGGFGVELMRLRLQRCQAERGKQCADPLHRQLIARAERRNKNGCDRRQPPSGLKPEAAHGERWLSRRAFDRAFYYGVVIARATEHAARSRLLIGESTTK